MLAYESDYSLSGNSGELPASFDWKAAAQHSPLQAPPL